MNKRRYSLGEEIFNSTSHGIGMLIALASLVLMILISISHRSGIGTLASIVFGLTLLLLYTSSTLYHALTHEKAKKVFKILDHCTIYLLIAGTYTPYALITIGGNRGLLIFVIIWISALLGILLNAINLERWKILSIILYLAMGWAIVLYLPQLIAGLSTGGLVLLIAGGLAYTLGVVFYVVKKIPYFHSVWHLFVLAGSVCHILSVMLFVL